MCTTIAGLRVERSLTATVASTVPTWDSSIRRLTRGRRPGMAALGTLKLVTTGCTSELALVTPYSLPPDSGADGDAVPPTEPACAEAANSDSMATQLATDVAATVLRIGLICLTSADARLPPTPARGIARPC
jgi:hypothetical protein